MSARRVALVGGSGQLGSALRGALAGRDVVAPPHAALALEDGEALARFLDATAPAVLVNCAAYHHVDACERDPRPAFALNALAVDAAAEACAARGIAFATVSTDYVFDGALGRPYREDDAPNPVNAYGASKLAGELLVRRHGPRHYVFRTSGLFGTTGTSNKGYTLIDKVLAQAERGEPTRMVDDVVFSPSYAPHVACAIRDLIDAETFGTHHVVNAGWCTWYEFVRTAFAKAGLANAPLQPIAAAQLGSRTRRPPFSALAGRLGLPPWPDALDEYLLVRTPGRREHEQA